MCGTQWRIGGPFGQIQGLDFLAVDRIAQINGIEIGPALFRKIRLLEEMTLDKAYTQEGGELPP